MSEKQLMNAIKKTIRYAKKNGWINALFAAAERSAQQRRAYHYEPPSNAELQEQRTHLWDRAPKVSILVPAYETKEEYLHALLDSVKKQTYYNWELVIVDASADDQRREVVRAYSGTDARIFYYHLKENYGISGNSNEGLRYVSGSYTVLLDHDDLLTPDALYEMVSAALDAPEAVLIYSDEDKCDASGTVFHTPHRKPPFDLDLFLTNNYICHLAMLRTEVIKALRFRSEYEGAQDYDLFLRAAALQKPIIHVPKVLYHWRCHESSTAERPESKTYAYEAGRRALDDYFSRAGWQAHAEHDAHLGFYRISYEPDIFAVREDVGVSGGRLLRFGRVVGGAMEEDGTVCDAGLPARYSGYMNHAAIARQVPALDLRNLKVRPELGGLWEEYCGRMQSEDVKALSLLFCEEVRRRGYLLVYTPWVSVKKRR